MGSFLMERSRIFLSAPEHGKLFAGKAFVALYCVVEVSCDVNIHEVGSLGKQLHGCVILSALWGRGGGVEH